MLAEGVIQVSGALFQVAGKLELFTQSLTSHDFFCLLPFPLPDRARRREQLFESILSHEKATVIVGKNHIARLHFAIPDARSPQG